MEHAPIPYRTLDPEIEVAIRADRASGRANPHAFDDADVVRREPNPTTMRRSLGLRSRAISRRS